MFEWDVRKAMSNLAKHNVSFEEAASVFGDEDAFDSRDVLHSTREQRRLRLGSLAVNGCCGRPTRSGERNMAKRFASLARVRQIVLKSLAMPEPKIDYSDIPPISPARLRRMKRVGKRAMKRSEMKFVVIRSS